MIGNRINHVYGFHQLISIKLIEKIKSIKISIKITLWFIIDHFPCHCFSFFWFIWFKTARCDFSSPLLKMLFHYCTLKHKRTKKTISNFIKNKGLKIKLWYRNDVILEIKLKKSTFPRYCLSIRKYLAVLINMVLIIFTLQHKKTSMYLISGWQILQSSENGRIRRGYCQ